MATKLAGKLAHPILKKAEEDALRAYKVQLAGAGKHLAAVSAGDLRNYAVARFFNPGPVSAAIREKLEAAAIHPAVVQDWANEPKRRVGMAKMELDRHARAEQAQKAAANRLEKKRMERARFSRAAKKTHRSGVKKSLVSRITGFVRGAARGQ